MDCEKNRINKVDEILRYFKEEINKKNKTISKLLKTKHILKLTHTTASTVTIASSTGGILASSIIIPIFFLNSVAIFTGLSTMLTMHFSDCIMKKLEKNREILLLAINKQEEVFKIYVEDAILNDEEINEISNIYKSYFEQKNNVINKYN